MTRTYWMEFFDEEKHRGVCVVDVTDEDVAALLAENTMPPAAKPGAEWLAAAIRVAWLNGCNPGGAVGFFRIPPETPLPRNRLLTDDEAKRFAHPPVH